VGFVWQGLCSSLAGADPLAGSGTERPTVEYAAVTATAILCRLTYLLLAVRKLSWLKLHIVDSFKYQRDWILGEC
jgi:hypothetical protein